MVRLLVTSVVKLIEKSCRRTLSTMQGKVVVRRIEGESEMALSFKYSSPLVAEREFNFNRKQEEQVKIALNRIAQNVGKIGEKKLKKKLKKSSPATSTSDVDQSSNLIDTAIPQVSLVINGSEVDETTTNVHAFTPGAILRVGEVEFQVEVNPPMIKSLSLPKHIMAGFDVYPKLEVEFTQMSSCKFVWFKSETRFNSEGENLPIVDSEKKKENSTNFDFRRLKWEKVGEDFFYRAVQDDIGRYLKLICTPITDIREGPIQEIISPNEVTIGPGETPFDRRHAFTQSHVGSGRFRVVTYNILADLYADSDFSRSTLYPSCPPYALSIDYRKQLILKEIAGYHADIICLQEVDHKIFECDLTYALSLLNMEGHLSSKGGKVSEGLVCFYNKNKFSLVDQYNIELSQVVLNDEIFDDFKAAINVNEKLKTRMLERTTVLQLLVLECKDTPGKYVCVANTHLYFHPNADHIRLLQAGICLRQLENVIQNDLRKKLGEDAKIAVLFCGDFNSTPESGVYELMTTRFIPKDHERWNSLEEECVKGLSLSHPFNLMSACGCPEYTNYTTGFNGCLDYIFADQDHLSVEEVVPLPSHEEVIQFEALPSLTFPSDHISLVCTLRWKS